MNMKKVILDVDTGSDDAVAIMLAQLATEIDLVAVCATAGNQPLSSTLNNTLKVRELLKADFPVYRGCTTALVKDACPWRLKIELRATAVQDGKDVFIHADFDDLPEPVKGPQDLPAPMFYVDYLMHSKEKVTIVAVGPLTNLAVALVMEPRIVEKIEEIVIMGGGDNEANSSTCSEFNIFFDPEAAQRVFHCGAPITLIPLDATHRAYITKDDCQRFRSLNNPVASFAAELCERRILIHNQRQPLAVKDACALHDPLCIAYLIDSKVLTCVKALHVDVSLGGLTDGATVVDHRYFQDDRNVNFVYDGDRQLFADILAKAFARFS